MDKLQINMPDGRVAQLNRLEAQIRHLYTDGDVDPIAVEIGIKGVEDTIKKVRKDKEIKDIVINEASKYPEKTFEAYGAQIQRRNTAAKYDFETCNDPVFNELNEKMNEIKEAIKDRQAFLKSIKKKTTIIDDRTGEVCEIHPPAKSQGETIAIKFL